MFNVNELGPEDVYDKGSVTRSSQPRTIPPSPTGYVGRAAGGSLDPYGWGGPNRMGSGPKMTTEQSSAPTGTPAGTTTGVQENPGGVEGGYNFMTDPGYNFRFDEGMRGLEGSASARGGLLSGGFAKKAMRYGQDYASNEYLNVYNRIANIAGLGQVSAQSSGNYAMSAGQTMGTAAAQGATASAYGQQGASNAWANAANQIGQLPWGKVFKNSGGGGYDYPYDPYYSG